MTFVTFVLGLLGLNKKSVSFADDVKGAPEEQEAQEAQPEVSNEVVQPAETA
jgi:hypothetical protein